MKKNKLLHNDGAEASYIDLSTFATAHTNTEHDIFHACCYARNREELSCILLLLSLLLHLYTRGDSVISTASMQFFDFSV